MHFERIILSASPTSTLNDIDDLLQALKKLPIKVALHYYGNVLSFDELKNILPKNFTLNTDPENTSDLLNTDLVISMGGDGTFIRAAQKLVGTDIPITGINYGHLGFLTEVEKNKNIDTYLENVLKKENFYIQDYNVLGVKINDTERTCINDVAIFNTQIGTFNICVDDVRVYTARADGLLLASPLGSTAHSLTAGGPIITPTCDVVIITLICPMTLTNRPLIVNAKSKITIKIPDIHEKPYQISFDGDRMNLTTAMLEVFGSGKSIKVLHQSSRDIYSIYREKLGWNS